MLFQGGQFRYTGTVGCLGHPPGKYRKYSSPIPRRHQGTAAFQTLRLEHLPVSPIPCAGGFEMCRFSGRRDVFSRLLQPPAFPWA